uniref:Calpain catalytic domain-containing protein n=1 Tax=Callorhinchus milii TaxID=7868 RepID=A0A4W3JKC2_CALMI
FNPLGNGEPMEPGDCWFLAALGALTMNENMFSQVVPSNQSCQQNYCGIFHFRFWHFGDWTDVVVDDQLPTDERGNLIFVHSSDKNEFWCALLEKAYAKLQGSYADLHMGQISEALVDFTGGILIDIELAKAPDNLWQWMQKADNQRLFMGCSTPSGKLEFKLPNGLLLTHAYTVTGIKEVKKNQKEQLVRVRNPWGNAEWNGSWSDNSKEWDIVDPKVKKRLLLNRNDGEFWMALKDFMANFKRLVFCSPNPDFMIDQSHLQWHYACHQEKWVKGVTAGGKMRYKGKSCSVVVRALTSQLRRCSFDSCSG